MFYQILLQVTCLLNQISQQLPYNKVAYSGYTYTFICIWPLSP